MTRSCSFRKSIFPSLYAFVAIAALSMFTGVAVAIETASAIRGLVADESGKPIADATVRIRNEDTALTRSAQTNASGEFIIRNLPIASNYTVTAEHSGYSSASIGSLTLILGQTADLSFTLPSTNLLEEIVVTGSRLKAQVAVGPSATFGLQQLETGAA
ncbi:MAG: carboxypeptidase regulatory-like domain-containing protein, partial [Proteobacteria bacterium]|nr:carboxypeptidase regulatory-like domain-containing protein [Pseudomonadota bacterium]